MKLIECVPNFSCGKDKRTVQAIVDSISSEPNIYLLGVDIGISANRTVVSFAGPPESILNAAFKAINTSARLIDMQHHSGAHPRIGSCDVCPIIPLGEEINTCKEVAEELAQKVGKNLGIPVYMYGQSAKKKDRIDLAKIRQGQYEGFAEKMSSRHYMPDYGPNKFNPSTGATAIGVRDILVAYNVSLATSNLKVVNQIAATIRNQDKAKLKSGAITQRTVKAIGWFIEEYDCCQVSMNLLDYKSFSIKEASYLVQKLATPLDIKVIGSELVGLAPIDALLESPSSNFEKDLERIDQQVEDLGLNCHYPFDKHSKIIELKLNQLQN